MYEYLIPDEEADYQLRLVCCNCGEPCGTVEETFDYAGTHCTGGKRGTHRTGVYVSDCCYADFQET